MGQGAREEIDELQAAMLRALSSPHRVALIHLLMDGAREVREISDALQMSQVATSQHLAALRAVGLVEATRDGRTVTYQLSDPDVAVACRQMREVLVRRLARLGQLAAVASAEDVPFPVASHVLEVAGP